MVRKYYENNELTNEMKAVYATTKGKDDPGTAEEFMQLHGARIRESTTVTVASFGALYASTQGPGANPSAALLWAIEQYHARPASNLIATLGR